MKCMCCGSDRHAYQRINQNEFATCRRCGFMFSDRVITSHVVGHYRDIDPHKKVAAAKGPFFKAALTRLSAENHDTDRSILDIGCGFGYFLQHAAKEGWVPFGVEIVEDAVAAARASLGRDQIFHGTLQSANYPTNTFHAVTAWDVLFVVDEPLQEIIECYRILKPGSSSGIRLRNVLFEKASYHGYRTIQPVAGKMGIKRPYVFHSYCFSPKSLHYLLHGAGFENVRIQNSPLTKGDPYAYTPFSWLTTSAKMIIDTLAGRLFSLSKGRWILGPSLLAWAIKPLPHSKEKRSGDSAS
ncbi:hypothetical protein D3OALGA1CA_3620 [Olavius algarvensis associated proteobacterium Delta 3]|nr:hypothetical protein D3OALGA1CA_3620 [Olavius algarvensis associated proteobacterium Delta 3]CAB5147280.1 hypothetical protein D3OALGB2SA_4582 [Olavius algarvensis associated proteobacterium Delta 3]